MKKNFILLIACIGFLGFAYSVLAQLQLPNPLGNVNDFPTLITNIAQYIARLVGVLAVIMFIWAGILFLTSAGNEQRVSSAKKAVLYAVIGLAIALAGTGLIQLVTFIITGQS